MYVLHGACLEFTLGLGCFQFACGWACGTFGSPYMQLGHDIWLEQFVWDIWLLGAPLSLKYTLGIREHSEIVPVGVVYPFSGCERSPRKWVKMIDMTSGLSVVGQHSIFSVRSVHLIWARSLVGSFVVGAGINRGAVFRAVHSIQFVAGEHLLRISI